MVKTFDVRKYIIPLTKFLKAAPKRDRTKRSIGLVKLFVMKHTRAKVVVIGEELNRSLWEFGERHPKHKISVFVQKLSDGSVFVNSEGAPLKVEKKPEEKKKEGKKENLEEITTKEEPKKVEEKKEAPKKEDVKKEEKAEKKSEEKKVEHKKEEKKTPHKPSKTEK
ncbi:Ribosomal protein L31e [Candidatus Tiddalikarchaeum anstoanum]|nr:Ribosomal protein L31e [Candidatus Tiddalikarchaeum anstoanum]